MFYIVERQDQLNNKIVQKKTTAGKLWVKQQQKLLQKKIEYQLWTDNVIMALKKILEAKNLL